MQTYIADIIPSLQRFSRKLNDLTKLEQKHWVLIDDSTNIRTVFIFKENNELLVYENGVRNENNSWRYLDNQSIDIEINQIHYLMKHAFLDEAILALKRSGVNEYAFFVNETVYGRDLKSHSEIIRYLDYRYKKKPKEIAKRKRRIDEQLVIGLAIFIITIMLAFKFFKAMY